MLFAMFYAKGGRLENKSKYAGHHINKTSSTNQELTIIHFKLSICLPCLSFAFPFILPSSHFHNPHARFFRNNHPVLCDTHISVFIHFLIR
ncbi:hypothetical protein EYC84_007159 [Monilinia fructicola]|uniref:Uncharacterized protein n=1 Tax=Monilinia fructicola TaxID=38448 RepID=A0A5M9KAP0_MONFR|nr:hypothetical protein EYC84_007159 [Monilinia fructicola]